MPNSGSYRKKMKAAIHNPYLDTLGGGERYTMSFAKVLSDKGYAVDVEWKNENIRKDLEKRYGEDYSKINFVKDIKRGDGYDICFWVTDGSIPALKARRNFLHFQVPFHGVKGKSLLNKMKLFRVEKVICNSFFTKKVIDKEYGIESIVIYPPVDVQKIKPKIKKKQILFVGRFSQLKQAKHQDILIKAFKKFIKKGFFDWELILAGGTEVGVGDYIKKLEKLAKNLPVKLVKSPSFEKIKELYGTSRIFWSASGYGVDENVNPESVEHFGIVLVEAMAARSVPVAFNAGGHKEIIADGETGFLWNKERELIDKTIKLINEKGLIQEMSKKGQEASKVYEYQRFKAEVLELL